jgi:hypothetical protein
MAYRITYSEGSISKQTVASRKINRKPILIGIFAGVLALTLVIPAGRLWLRDLLLPGDEDITAGALEALAEDLGDGVSLGEAVDAFCYEIIHGQTD